jgi:hypothetical protein
MPQLGCKTAFDCVSRSELLKEPGVLRKIKQDKNNRFIYRRVQKRLTQALFPSSFGGILRESLAFDTTQLQLATLDVELRAELLSNKFCGRDILVSNIKWVWILTQVVHKAVVERCFTLLSHVTKNAVSLDFLD